MEFMEEAELSSTFKENLYYTLIVDRRDKHYLLNVVSEYAKPETDSWRSECFWLWNTITILSYIQKHVSALV